MTVTCNCMANVGGVCMVRNCKGEIRRLARKKISAEQAARFYEISAEAFDDYFGNENHGQ